MSDVVIRPLGSFEELEAGVELQKQTWGRHFDDVVSAALMRVVQKIGGVAAGAFDADERLVAMVFGLSGVRGGRVVHWSHMLAVETDWRGRGLGTLLKVYQRRRVLALGVERMYWTFDPLEARNAHFNINRLGVRIESYSENMYGSGDTSTLHRGIGTDRFVALWPLDDPRVQQLSERVEHTLRWDDAGMKATVHTSVDVKKPALSSDPFEDIVSEGAADLRDSEESGRVFVEIPPDIQHLKATRPDEASSWRTTTRRAFVHYFSQGMNVTGFVRDPGSDRCFYVLDHAAPE